MSSSQEAARHFAAKVAVAAIVAGAAVACGGQGFGSAPASAPASATGAPANAPSLAASPSREPTAALASAAPLPLPASDAAVAPGRYVAADSTYRWTFTVSAHGWSSLGPDFGVFRGSNESFAALAFWENPKVVYLDPCHWPATERQTGTSPADWVAAIGEVKELRLAAPSDITIGGYPGKRISITVPDDVEPEACVDGMYQPYEGRTHLDAGQIDDLWIVGIPGGERRVIVTTYFPTTPQDARDQLGAIVASMEIQPR